MATKIVKEREASGEDLSGITWTAEKPFMMIRSGENGLAASFFFTREDFDFALKKAMKNKNEIVYAAEVCSFKKIGDFKSGFGRNEEISRD